MNRKLCNNIISIIICDVITSIIIVYLSLCTFAHLILLSVFWIVYIFISLKYTLVTLLAPRVLEFLLRGKKLWSL